MVTRPRWLLHLEGSAILGLTLYLYHSGHYRWWLFAVLFLAPDLFLLGLLGYLKDVRWGAAAYNLAHTVRGPLVLLLVGLAVPSPQCNTRTSGATIEESTKGRKDHV
jgi:hypothetical protein